eukprot:Gregarina_sp_Pseudo_9__5239@NODE_590_length_2539_cov_32_946000_g556_i0_p1_GENE_NODE_590_length_2539_cov_32_946000_g556_i0NODE_590_length_2539_cov_32_946000_g556_i0_p1_ORF_typecomplete_len399_score41_86_NODE_590_length_2539_cov_32_946000_g556_i0761272
MVVKFAQLRSIFSACQTESAVAVCGTRQALPVRRVLNPQAGLLQPPPSSLGSSSDFTAADQIELPKSRKGTRLPDLRLEATHYTLDRPSLLTVSSDPRTAPPTKVSADVFLSFLQQKHRDPRKFVCIDLSRHCCLKFSLFLTPAVLEDVTSDVTILVCGFSDSAYAELVSLLPSAPRAIILLDGPLSSFLQIYPFCFVESDFTMPGPTVVLSRPEKGLALYLSDLRTARSSAQMLQEVFDVRFILNLSGTDLQNYYCSEDILIADMKMEEGQNRGEFYTRAVERLIYFAAKGLPVLVNDISGCCHAPAVAALFLILLGWTPDEVIYHITSRRGTTSKRKQLIDEHTIKAIRLYYDYRKTAGPLILPAPNALTSLYPSLCDDIYNNDAACVPGFGKLQS